jgi:hypothetical protein
LLTAQVILIFPFLVGVIVLLFAIPGGEYIAEAGIAGVRCAAINAIIIVNHPDKAV